ncbi:MAG: SBBP repeat-containing protein [Rhodospirillales bacterium]|nr:SBBP repeat-containing protein [Rhodospirillales bacterium]
MKTGSEGARAVTSALLIAAGMALAAPAWADDPLWVQQFGTLRDDQAEAVATDRFGHVYVAGATEGDLSGANQGEIDAFVAKFDAEGRPEWQRQRGAEGTDIARAIATDASGNVYAAGSSSLNGGKSAWLVKYGADGDEVWAQQMSTWHSVVEARGVAVDRNGDIYVAGETQGALGGTKKGGILDAWVIKFDAAGHRLWSHQPGTSGDDAAAGIATDADGNVYVVGSTSGALGGPNKGDYDAWVVKFDADGHWLWKRQPGTTGRDFASSVAVDASGNVYVFGGTEGALGGAKRGGQSDFDTWLAKFDAGGRWQWKRQFGTPNFDTPSGVAVDADGTVAIVGYSHQRNGNDQAWLARFSTDGLRLSKSVPAIGEIDWATGMAVDAGGSAYVAGLTWSISNPGGQDAFVTRYAPATQ